MLKRFRFVFATVVVLCLALGLFVAYSASQPVVSCATAPKKPLTTAREALTRGRMITSVQEDTL